MIHGQDGPQRLIMVDGAHFYDECQMDGDWTYVLRPGDGFTGWRGGGTMRRDDTSKELSHGSFSARGYRNAKLPTIRGSIVAKNDRLRMDAERELEGILSDGQAGTMEVIDRNGDRTWAEVYLQIPPDPRPPYEGSRTSEFQIGFWVPDATVYGREIPFARTGAGSVSLWQKGNVASAPVVTVAGNFPSGYTLTYRGGVYERQVPLNGSETIDFRDGYAVRGNAVQLGGYGRVDLFEVPPGAHASPLSIVAPNATGITLTGYVREAWA